MSASGPLYGNMPSGQGSLVLELYDFAIFEAIGAVFLPMPNPQNDPKIAAKMQQVLIPGLCGPGHRDDGDINGRIPVIFSSPEDIYNRYLLPGIRINRSAITTDSQRLYPTGLGAQYRVPYPAGNSVTVGGQSGPSLVAVRPWANPENLTYDIEVRAREPQQALRMLDFIRYMLPERGAVKVRSTDGTSSLFTYYRQGISDTSELTSSLNRFSGFLLTYEIQAEIDEHMEHIERTITQPVRQHGTISKRSRVMREGD